MTRAQMFVRSSLPQMYNTLDLEQEIKSHEESIASREWDEVMAEAWSRLQRCQRCYREALSLHLASAPDDFIAYELASSSDYVAIVALEACARVIPRE